MLGRYLRRVAVATALLLALAAFGYSPYAFPHALDGDFLAAAYRVRYLFLQATLWTLGPAHSYPAFAAKVLAVVALLGLALGAALLPFRIRRQELHRAGDAHVDRT